MGAIRYHVQLLRHPDMSAWSMRKGRAVMVLAFDKEALLLEWSG